MRPFTADETFLTAQGTSRWHNRSTSRRSSTFEEKQIHTLLQTSNVKSFLQTASLPKDSYTLDSMQNLNQGELHMQLISIRSKFDTTRKRFSVDDYKLKELELISEENLQKSNQAQVRIQILMRKIEDLTQIISNVQSQQEECIENMQVNFHMLDRSKKNKIFLEIKANKLKNDLRRVNFALIVENNERFKERASKSYTKKIYQLVSRTVSRERNEKQSVIQGISKDMKIREFMKSRREERATRYIEITEQAANEAKDRKEINIREGVLVHKMTARLLAYKLREMKKINFNIEEAFLKIRVVTGESSVPELVQKFLTREQTFKELKFTIDMSRKSIEEIVRKNLDIERIIGSATVYDKEARGSELFRLKEKYTEKLKEVQVERMKLHTIKVVYEKVREWSRRICVEMKVYKDSGTLRNRFWAIAKKSVEVLKSKGFRF